MAQFDLTADILVPENIDQTPVAHPDNEFSFIIRRATINENKGNVTLHCNMEFDAPDVENSKEVFQDNVANVLNVLVLVSNADLRFDRVHKIFDWAPNRAMRRGLIFAHDPPETDPDTLLKADILDTANLLLKADSGKQVSSAMRWFHLGVSASEPEEQFHHFWRALELVAQHAKPTGTVNDACPQCQGKLYCESCDNYPEHRPYPKQAIAFMCAQIAPEHPEFFDVANKARNSLLHGKPSKEIEEAIGMPLHAVIDPLSQITWRALVTALANGLSVEDRPKKLNLANASTFVKWRLSASVVMDTVVPTDANGNPDIELMTGIDVGFETT